MFVDFFIRRPIFATVCSLLIILAGAAAIPTLPVARFPDLAPPQVFVVSNYIGASAQDPRMMELASEFLRSKPTTAPGGR